MILTITGSEIYPFNRLLGWVDQLSKEIYPDESFIIQSGSGFQKHTFKADQVTEHQFVKYKEIKSMMNDARIVIVHGGVGSVLDVLDLGKTPVIVPRLQHLGEHTDNHQLDFANRFYDEFGIPYVTSYRELVSSTSKNNRRPKIKSERESLVRYLDQVILSWSQD